MSNINVLSPIIRKWEGGYVNDPDDKGGATNMGITISTWKQIGYDKDGDGDIDEADIKLLSPDDFTKVLRKYWDRWDADNIVNQSVANILVDWVWASGKWGIIIPQRWLKVTADGVAGPATLDAVNRKNPREVFDAIYHLREQFLQNIVTNTPSQKKFINGWLNRLADFKYSD